MVQKKDSGPGVDPYSWAKKGVGLGEKLYGATQNPFDAGYLDPGEAGQVPGGPNTGQSRGMLMSALDPLQKWAMTGEGPSAAQSMLESTRQGNIAQGQQLAAATPGATPGAQMRLAGNAAATANAAAGGQAAQLRAQEQQAAMGQYMQGLTGLQRGDIDLYRAMAQAYADKERANAQVAAENAAANRGILGGLIGGVTGGLGI